jgi:hypothetical protein
MVMTPPCSSAAPPRMLLGGPQRQEEPLLQQKQHSSGNNKQQLLAAGTRLWGGWLSSSGLCKVRIYDFALYADTDAARRVHAPFQSNNPHHHNQQQQPSALPILNMFAMLQRPPLLPPTTTNAATSTLTAPPPSPETPTTGPLLVAERLLHSPDIPVSVVLRTCRSLPTQAVLSEYEGVLRRRLQRAGHDPQDPALHQLLHQLHQGASQRQQQHLHNTSSSDSDSSSDSTDSRGAKGSSSSSSSGSHLAKGTIIHFQRLPGGRLAAAVDGLPVASVVSPALCTAFFSTYLGQEPVSEEARSAAGQSLLALLAQPGSEQGFRPAGRRQRLRCSGPELESCCVQLLE